MTIQQISVFLENKYGKLHEILKLIAQQDIRVLAATVSDTSDFGILRIITTDQLKAFEILKSNKISANLNDVVAIEIEAKSGEFARKIELFTQAGVNIEYMYCFSMCEKGFLVFRTKDIEAAQDVIRRNDLNYISENNLCKL